jgi:N-acetyl-anhydromuramoyl-L-alanine amidase
MPEAVQSVWHQGWHRSAKRLDSPNFGSRPDNAHTDLLVIHSISLPPGEYGGTQVQALFTNQLNWDEHPYFQSIRGMQVSAHFFIDRTGLLWQFVSVQDRAWHAGQSHYRGRNNCNDDSIGIELEGIEGDVFEPVQYRTLVALCRDLAQHLSISFIAGHEHIAPGRKKDPGTGFDWTFFEKNLALPAIVFPELAAKVWPSADTSGYAT